MTQNTSNIHIPTFRSHPQDFVPNFGIWGISEGNFQGVWVVVSSPCPPPPVPLDYLPLPSASTYLFLYFCLYPPRLLVYRYLPYSDSPSTWTYAVASCFPLLLLPLLLPLYPLLPLTSIPTAASTLTPPPPAPRVSPYL